MKKDPFAADLLAEMRRQANADTLSVVHELLSTHGNQREAIKSRLSSGIDASSNGFDPVLLDQQRIFHISQIREICIRYRLRFLDSASFKDGIPAEAVNQIHELERAHHCEVSGFRIVAPASAFKLKNVNDPLLFAPVSNGYYYMVHQWGKDLSIWRKYKNWPIRNFANFILCCLIISAVFTMLVPSGELDSRVPMAKIIIFLFAFKSFFAVFLYSFYILGKRFSKCTWDSPYFNN